MIKKLMLAGSALALLGIMTPTEAAVIVSLGSSQPSTGEILATLNPDNLPDTATTATFGWRRNNSSNSSNWDVAISFQAQSAGILDELGLYIASSSGGGGNTFTIQIRESTTAPAGDNANTTGTVLLNTSSTIDVGSQTGNILKFSFTEADAVAISQDKWYTVSLIWPTSDAYSSSKQFSLQNTNSAFDADGELISAGGWRRNPGSTWTHDTGRNYLFYASSAIPEPSTYLLFGTAAASIALYRRRQNKR